MVVALFNTQNIVLFVAAFFTASISGAFGMVGGAILLSVMAQFYKMDVLIPLHGMIQMISNFSRSMILFPSVIWKVVISFVVGAAVGGYSGSFFISSIPESYYKIGLGIFVLWAIFKSKPRKKIEIPGKWYALGWIAAFVSLFTGTIGILIGTSFLNEGFEKKQIVATQSICQFAVHVIKVLVFFSVGFVMGPYLGTFSGMVVMTVLGSYLGTRLLEKIPEKIFFVILKTIIVFLTARLIISGITGLHAQL